MDPATGFPTDNLMAEAATFFEKECGVTLKTSSEACAHPKVKAFVEAAITRTNDKLVSRAAKIKAFRFIQGDFSTPGTELTPTLKLKRKVTENKYIHLVQDMYSQQAKL